MDFKLTELATNPRMAGRREGGREVWGGRAAGVGFGRGGAGGGAGGRGRGGAGGAAEGRGGEEDRTESTGIHSGNPVFRDNSQLNEYITL